MAGNAGEISALLNLIEDPDEAVYQTVSSRLVEMGSEILPALEEMTELEDDPVQLERISQIISVIVLNRLEDSLLEWSQTDEKSLLDAAFFIHEFISKNVNRSSFFFEIEKVRKSIWLELNHYLTPLEEINIFNKVLFAHFQYQTKEVSQSEIIHYDPGNLLFKKTSNAYPIAALYVILGEMLGIHLEAVAIPKQNLLAYIDSPESGEILTENDILFYLDPGSGQVYSQKDIESYIQKLSPGEKITFFSSQPRVEFLKKWLIEIARYEKRNRSIFNFERIMEMIKLI